MTKKILIISPVPTHPTFAGNRACILSYAEMLKEMGYSVYLLWIADFNSTQAQEDLTKQYWKDHLFIFKKTQFHRIIAAFFKYTRFKIKGYFKVDDIYPYGIKRIIKKIQHREQFHAVIINYIYLSKLCNYIDNAKKIIFTHDVFTYKFQFTGLKSFSVTPDEEAKALNRADTILAIQENEAVFYEYLTLKKVLTTYSYFPVKETPFLGNVCLMYLAGPNKYNQEAIMYFIKNVFSNLKLRYPDIRLLIGGRICGEIENSLHDDNIDLYGDVSDLMDFYSLGDIVINPTFNGTGLKIKTFEAMAYGKVVIGDPHTIIGIYNKETAPVLQAQSTDEYCIHLDLLFGHPEKTKLLKEASIQYIRDLNDVVKSRFREAIEN